MVPLVSWRTCRICQSSCTKVAGLNEGFGFMGWSFVKASPAGVRCGLETDDHLTPVDRVKRVKWREGFGTTVQHLCAPTDTQLLSRLTLMDVVAISLNINDFPMLTFKESRPKPHLHQSNV